MSLILKENETLQDLVERQIAAAEQMKDIAPVAWWYEELNGNGRVKDIHFSPRMREMLGYKSEAEFPDALNTLMTFTYPDDMHIMLDDAIAAGTGKIPKYDVRYRIRTASGSKTSPMRCSVKRNSRPGSRSPTGSSALCPRISSVSIW